MGRMPLHASTNYIQHPANYFLSENKLLFPRMRMYLYINRRNFDVDKRILKTPHTDVEFLLLIQRTVNSLSKWFTLVIIEYATP